MDFTEKLKKIQSNNTTTPSKFIGRVFELRDITHKEHLKTDSYAKHKALNELYDQLIDQIDTFVESYQGKYGIVEFAIGSINVIDYMEYIEEFAKYTELARTVFKDDYLKNQIDEMTSVIYSTIYKLKYLKK